MRIGRLKMATLLFGNGTGLMPNQLNSPNVRPFRMPPQQHIRIALVYPRDFEKEAQRLANELEHGSSYSRRLYSGFERVFKTKLEIERHQISSLSLDYEEDAKKYIDIIDNIPPASDLIMLCIIPRTPKALANTPYYIVKKFLIKKRKQSQMVTADIIRDAYRFRMSLFPIAMQIFAKAGGVPYALSAPLGIADLKTLNLMIGVGLSKIRNLETGELSQYIGYANFFAAHGIWLFSEFFVEPYKGDEIRAREKLASAFERLILNSVKKIVEEEKARKNGDIERINLIIHYSGKQISTLEEEAVISASADLSVRLKRQVNVAILKVFTTTIYRIFDDASETFHIAAGTYVQIHPNVCLLSTMGFLPECRRIIGRGTPRPLLISIKSRGSEPLDLETLVYSVFAMARVNYAGLTLFTREPATTRYSRRIAYFLNRFNDETLLSDAREFLRRTLWFI